MRIYTDLADWYPLLTPLADYADEAAVYAAILRAHLGSGRHRLLELGAGAGHNAHYLARDFALTLTDLSPRMLAWAQHNCPDARCLVGDMRALRLEESHDAVFIHDAIGYMRTEADLAAALATAAHHLRPGGVLVLAPDWVQETFQPHTHWEGADGEGRSMRYLEWMWQRPGQTAGYVIDYTLAMREGEAEPRVVNDRHENGLFPRATWQGLLAEAGLQVVPAPVADPDHPDLFVAVRVEA